MAEVSEERQETVSRLLGKDSYKEMTVVWERLKKICQEALGKYQKYELTEQFSLLMKFEGSDTNLLIKIKDQDIEAAFLQKYKKTFGFVLENRSILIESAKVKLSYSLHPHSETILFQ